MIPFWKLFGCCASSVTEGYIERMMARHSATLGSGAQARAGVIPLQSTASTDAPFSRSKRVTATIPCREDRCSGLKHGHASTTVYCPTNWTSYFAKHNVYPELRCNTTYCPFSTECALDLTESGNWAEDCYKRTYVMVCHPPSLP